MTKIEKMFHHSSSDSLALVTSIPQKSGILPQKSGTYTRKIRKFFLLREASRLLFKFYVRSYIRTFISFRMYYRIPPPPNIIFIGAVESPVRVGLPKNPESHTKKIRKFIPKKSRKTFPFFVCPVIICHVAPW